jgi:hypothetical protein
MLNTTNKTNIVPAQFAAAVAPNGTVVFGYPNGGLNLAATGYTKGNYLLANNQHKLQIGQNVYSSPKDFTLAFNANASGITVTNKTANAWPAGAVANLQLNLSGIPDVRYTDQAVTSTLNAGLVQMTAVALDLGSPIAGAAASISAAQAVAAAGNLTIAGALASGGVAYMDVPRTVQFVSTNAGDTAQTATITGADEYGQNVTETVTLNGTTVVTSKKALATISKIAISAATVGNISAGASNTLGLPIAVYKAAVQLVKESQDGAVPTAGTFANADGSTPSATTGDVRGTYIPNATPDGSKGYVIFALVPDKTDIGVTNYAV